MKYGITIFFVWINFAGYCQEQQHPGLSWPRDIILEDHTITLYQPQLESFKDNIIEGRMAISIKLREKELIFGAASFRASVETDLDERVVILKKIDIIQTRFPDIPDDKVDQFARLLEEKIEGATQVMSLDRLLASLELVDVQKDLSEKINNDPPKIYYRQNPTVLVMIDGDPIFNDTENKDISYVVNTPYFLVKDKKTSLHYLRGGKFWYSSDEVTTGWSSLEKVPTSVFKLSEKAMEGYKLEDDSLMMAMTEPPELIVSTQPAELVIVDGEPDYKSIEGTSLLYVDNTESDIIMDISTQHHYILLAGRWYFSRSLQDEDWTFREPGELPEDFSRIPAESDMGNVRTSIPGTEEAQIAVLEQTIPQTAIVDRKTASVKVSYDGNPKFTKIEGTSISYAENADKTVILTNNRYYCVDDGIWFESDKATGPWEVSVQRPEQVNDIPPESPVYNVKYVYIYDSTPDVVYIGYTPGYTCSFVYGGVVVYGTGYYYRPWYYTYYYPRPATWGYHVHYNPWTGWGFSIGFSYGWFSYGWHQPYYGWWGPAGYRYGYRHGYYRGYRHGYYSGYNAGRRAGYVTGYRAGQRYGSNNLYRNRADGVRSTGLQTRQSMNRDQVSSRNRVSTSNNRANQVQNRSGTQNKPTTRQNDVYAGRDGNVYRRDNNSGTIQQRSNGQWSSSNRSSYPQQINRESQSRQQGTQRYNNYNSNRSRSATTRPSSGRTGGGGRRR